MHWIDKNYKVDLTAMAYIQTFNALQFKTLASNVYDGLRAEFA